MIAGIGTDIIAIARIRGLLERHGRRFAQRILGESELAAFDQNPDPAAFVAKRFAAKEATAKAFGSGFRHGLSLKHIQVVNDAAGKPLLQLSGRAREQAEEAGIDVTHLSLSDETDYAVAFVVMESKG